MRARGLWGFELGDYWPATFVAEATRHDMPVIAYTVNDERTMRALIEIGVRGIETDDPPLLIRVARALGVR
jgi:glycerophosphoryl diester phosphodiesterase